MYSLLQHTVQDSTDCRVCKSRVVGLSETLPITGGPYRPVGTGEESVYVRALRGCTGLNLTGPEPGTSN